MITNTPSYNFLKTDRFLQILPRDSSVAEEQLLRNDTRKFIVIPSDR